MNDGFDVMLWKFVWWCARTGATVWLCYQAVDPAHAPWLAAALILS